MRHDRYTELHSIEKVISALGMRLLIRDMDGFLRCATPAAVGVQPGDLPDSSWLPLRAPANGLLAALRQYLSWAQVTSKELHQRSGLARETCRRLLKGSRTRVLAPLERLLAVVGSDFVLIDPRGDSLVLALPLPSGAGGVPLLPRSAGKGGCRSKGVSAPGRLGISKRSVVALYQEHHQSYAEIAMLSGVSRERVRQIIRQAGCISARQRALKHR
jgi:predicted transcriptional regulator